MAGITILTIHDRISCFHSLKPFLFSDRAKDFTYTADSQWCLTKDRNRILVIVRLFIKPDVVDLELLKKLREKYERIAYFHDDAGGGIPRLQVLPYVDLFYSKALFRDRSHYARPLYGKELFSDYYHRKYGVVDPDWTDRPTEDRPEQLAKLRVSWNIGVGDYPRDKLRQRAGVAVSMALGMKAVKPFYTWKKFPADPIAKNRGLFDVHARIGLASRPSIAYQRKIILEKIKGNPNFLTGSVSQKTFNFEAAHSKIILSPFGWGELCLRDYEAVFNGSLLLKPDMSHLETWPDIFVPDETYISFDWDSTDLVEKAEKHLADDAARLRIARQAVDVLRDQLDQMPDRFAAALAEIEGNR